MAADVLPESRCEFLEQIRADAGFPAHHQCRIGGGDVVRRGFIMKTASVSTAIVDETKRGKVLSMRRVALGAVTGLIASLIMAMYAMIAALTYQGVGFFTPLYHIASLVISPDHMMMSMQQADAGQSFAFYAGPALVGAAIHMMTGAAFGAMFALIAGAARLRGIAVLVAGVLWGVVVYLSSAFVLLGLAATAFGSGDQIKNMGSLVGQGTFFVEHVIYGAALGALMWRAARRAR